MIENRIPKKGRKKRERNRKKANHDSGVKKDYQHKDRPR